MKIVMVGSGYVGLVSGACFADFGHEVVCVDKVESKIAALKQGEIPIFWTGLSELVRSNSEAGRLSFTTDLAGPVAKADAVFLAVGTPSRRGDGFADLSYVYAAAREIAQSLNGYTVIVTQIDRSGGIGDEVERIIRELRPDADFAVVSNPEFLREARRSTTSSAPIASSSAPMIRAPRQPGDGRPVGEYADDLAPALDPAVKGAPADSLRAACRDAASERS